MTFQMNQQAYARNVGLTTTSASFIAARDPTTSDTNYPLGQFWQNTSSPSLWYLNSLASSAGSLTANWIKIEESSEAILTLTGDTGGAVSPSSNNINILASTTGLSFAGSTPTLTLGGTLNVAHGGTGANTLTGVLTGNGTSAITGNAVTQHGILLGGASNAVSSLSVATNGQLPIGSTGANPVLATLTAGAGVSITNGAGSITIASSGILDLTVTSVNHAASPYTVLTTDEFLSVDCSSGVVTLNFPNTAATGKTYVVKDKTGSSSSNNITITTAGGTVTFDGATSKAMSVAYQAWSIIFDGSNYEIF